MLGAVCHSAIAGYGTEKGKTTCYIFKSDKLIKKLPCSYELSVSGTAYVGGTGHEFEIKGFGNISTSHAFVVKMDDNYNVIKDKRGNQIVTFNTDINEKPAVVVYRNSKDFKDLKLKTTYTPVNPRPNMLSCIQSKDKSLELCVPSTATNLASGG